VKISKLLLGVTSEKAYSPVARYTGLVNVKSVPTDASVEVVIADERIVESESGINFEGCGYPFITGRNTIEIGVLLLESLLLK
jgi:hypothetical protein